MYNNSETMGDRLKKYRETKGYNQQQFSEILEIKQQSLSKYENGYQGIPDEIKLKLIKDKVNINWLFTGEGEMFIEPATSKVDTTQKVIPLNKDIFPVKIENDIQEKKEDDEEWQGLSSRYLLEDSYSEANKNKPKSIDLINIINENINTSKAIPIPEALKEFENNIIAIIENSDSMEPTVKKSAVVICDMLGFQGDGIYLIKLNGKYMVKRVSARLNTYLISSDNKIYESFEVPIGSKEIRIGGQVRCVTNILY